MKTLKKAFTKTILGTLEIEYDDFVRAIHFVEVSGEIKNDSITEPGLSCIKQLNEFFRGERKTFDLPIKIDGTAFQKSVWNKLREIPYGETRSYGEIAAALGNPKSARAVGNACNLNPMLIVVPCHRVVGKDGSMIGFAAGLERKRKLIDLEKVNI